MCRHEMIRKIMEKLESASDTDVETVFWLIELETDI